MNLRKRAFVGAAVVLFGAVAAVALAVGAIVVVAKTIGNCGQPRA